MQEGHVNNKLIVEPAEVYHAFQAISSHGLMEMLRSPAHFQAKYLTKKAEDVETEAYRVGRICHSAILEPEIFKARAVVKPDLDYRTKAGKEALREWTELLKPDAIVLDEKDLDQILGMINAVQAHPLASRILQGGVPELSGYFQDATYQVPCKFRPDYLHEDGIVVELKTCKDASPTAFAKAIANFNYHLQAAFYVDGFSVVYNKPRGSVPHVFIAIEKDPPYGIGVYSSVEAMLDKGRELYQRALEKYVWCLANNKWPGYSEEAVDITLPHWAWSA